jgi:hypothetical protein
VGPNHPTLYFRRSDMDQNSGDMIRQLVQDTALTTMPKSESGSSTFSKWEDRQSTCSHSRLSNDFRRAHFNHAMEKMLRREMMHRILSFRFRIYQRRYGTPDFSLQRTYDPSSGRGVFSSSRRADQQLADPKSPTSSTRLLPVRKRHQPRFELQRRPLPATP